MLVYKKMKMFDIVSTIIQFAHQYNVLRNQNYKSFLIYQDLKKKYTLKFKLKYP